LRKINCDYEWSRRAVNLFYYFLCFILIHARAICIRIKLHISVLLKKHGVQFSEERKIETHWIDFKLGLCFSCFCFWGHSGAN